MPAHSVPRRLAPECLGDFCQEFVGSDRFLKDLAVADAPCLLGVASHVEDAEIGSDHLRLLSQVEPADAGHDDIRKQQIDLMFDEKSNRLITVVGDENSKPMLAQKRGYDAAYLTVVLDEEDGELAAHALPLMRERPRIKHPFSGICAGLAEFLLLLVTPSLSQCASVSTLSKVDELRVKGDCEGADVWLRIIIAIGMLGTPPTRADSRRYRAA
jgi:hypothetical protein